MSSWLFLVAFWSPSGRGWPLGSLVYGMFLCFLVFLLIFHVVFRVGCGAWLYLFLISVFFFTLNYKLFI